jgi:uncharacterized protein YsxB (DUF464 family)
MAIQIQIDLNDNGLLRHIHSEGHGSVTDQGISVACAAVSVLLRSFSRSIAQQDGMILDWDLSQKGLLDLEIAWESSLEEWYKGQSDLLLQGLQDVSQDFPNEVHLEKNLN